MLRSFYYLRVEVFFILSLSALLIGQQFTEASRNTSFYLMTMMGIHQEPKNMLIKVEFSYFQKHRVKMGFVFLYSIGIYKISSFVQSEVYALPLAIAGRTKWPLSTVLIIFPSSSSLWCFKFSPRKGFAKVLNFAWNQK